LTQKGHDVAVVRSVRIKLPFNLAGPPSEVADIVVTSPLLGFTSSAGDFGGMALVVRLVADDDLAYQTV
jgi:hypothetical protein